MDLGGGRGEYVAVVPTSSTQTNDIFSLLFILPIAIDKWPIRCKLYCSRESAAAASERLKYVLQFEIYYRTVEAVAATAAIVAITSRELQRK